MKPERFRWPALAIFSVALAVRLINLLQIRRAPFFDVLMGDSRAYDAWARRIAGGDWLGHEVFYQAPLYPYFLGAVYAIAGRDRLVAGLCQVIVGSLACMLLGLAGWRFFRKPVGLAAGLALALYAPAIFFDGLIQKSVLDVFFISLALWLLSGLLTREERLRRWFWLGLAMGGLCLTRENAVAFVGAILLWAFARAGVSGRERVATVVVFLLGLAIVLAPVAVRNSVLGGGFYVTTSQFGPNFYVGNNPRADGTYMSLRFGRGAPEYERRDATELAEHALGRRRLTPAEVSSYWTERGLEFIRAQPRAWLGLLARKLALLWNATEMLDTESQESYAEWSSPLRLAGPVGHFGVLVPLALFGGVVTWPRRARLWILHTMLAAYAASVVMFYVFARYRYPLVPLLVLFSAAGVVEAARFVRAGSVVRTAGTLAAVALVAVFTNWPMLSADLMRAITENNLGAALHEEGRFDEAVGHCRRAIALRPDYAPAYNNMGVALRAKGHLDEAVATYGRALAVWPDYPDAHYNLANALLAQGNAEQAAFHFRLALRRIPGSALAHNNLGIALASRGDLDGATAEFQKALRLDPDSATTHRNLGDALASQGRRGEAIEHLRRAVQLDPADASAHYDLAGSLLEAGRLEEAIAHLRAALQLRPGSVEALNNLGIALGSQGKLNEAIDLFQEALRLKPAFEDARRNLRAAREARRQLGRTP